MNYQKVYDQLVQKNHVFSSGEYFEIHHKVPKCMGGNDEKSNLVNLTAREHYIAHLLLVKITEQNGDKNAHGKIHITVNIDKIRTVIKISLFFISYLFIYDKSIL